MGVLADRLDGMRVRVVLPDGSLAAELRGRAQVRLSFATGVYLPGSERNLERRLEQLANLLWMARTREYYAAVSAALGEPVTGETRPVTQRDRDFRAARDALVATGEAPGTATGGPAGGTVTGVATGRAADRRVQISVRGLRVWRVTIADGTVRALSEAEFIDRFGEASAALIHDLRAKIRELKLRVYR